MGPMVVTIALCLVVIGLGVATRWCHIPIWLPIIAMTSVMLSADWTTRSHLSLADGLWALAASIVLVRGVQLLIRNRKDKDAPGQWRGI